MHIQKRALLRPDVVGMQQATLACGVAPPLCLQKASHMLYDLVLLAVQVCPESGRLLASVQSCQLMCMWPRGCIQTMRVG